MIEIKKGIEPRELLQYRQQKFSSYANMPLNVKQKVIESLLSEQGHLCAYCMSRINVDSKKHPATIEHCTPQSVTDEKERLNYKNMLAVCWGNRDAHSNDNKSCDAKRGSLPQEQQTMKKIDVFNGRTLTDIQYAADGTIFSDDPEVDEDLNKRLNLNCKARELRECRLQSLRALHKMINQRYPNKIVPKKFLQDYMRIIQNRARKESHIAELSLHGLTRRYDAFGNLSGFLKRKFINSRGDGRKRNPPYPVLDC